MRTQPSSQRIALCSREQRVSIVVRPESMPGTFSAVLGCHSIWHLRRTSNPDSNHSRPIFGPRIFSCATCFDAATAEHRSLDLRFASCQMWILIFRSSFGAVQHGGLFEGSRKEWHWPSFQKHSVGGWVCRWQEAWNLTIRPFQDYSPCHDVGGASETCSPRHVVMSH